MVYLVDVSRIQQMLDVSDEEAQKIANEVIEQINTEAHHAAQFLVNELYELVEEATREGVMHNLPEELNSLSEEQLDDFKDTIEIDLEFETVDYFKALL